jgi:hypothetical protein
MSRVRVSLALACLALCPLVGCGEGPKSGEIVVSPEAKAADQSGQKAMQEFMQSKGASKKGR